MSLGSTINGDDDKVADPTNTLAVDDKAKNLIPPVVESIPLSSLKLRCSASPDTLSMTKHNNDTATQASANNRLIPSNEITAATNDTPPFKVEAPPIAEALSKNTEDPSLAKTKYTQPERTFRQRRAIQLQPYTIDRLTHQSLLGGKRTSTPFRTTMCRGTLPSSQVPGSMATQDYNLDSQSYMDNVPSDSDDEYQDIEDSGATFDLDFGYMDDSDDSASQIIDNTPTDSITTRKDDDSDSTCEGDEQQSRRKRRRFRILDDEDDGTKTTAANRKTDDKDIFALAPFDPLPPLITKHSSNQLITYKRPKGKRRDKGNIHTERYGPIDTHVGSISSSSAQRVDNDTFSLISLDELDRQHLSNKSNGDHRDQNDDNKSIHAMESPPAFETAPPAPKPVSSSSDPVLSAPKPVSSSSNPVLSASRISPAGATRQRRHLAPDDDGFIVDEDGGHDERRRNTTLKEVRKNKRTLKGILPNSFVKVFQKQLDQEEQTVRRQPTITNRNYKKTDDTHTETGNDTSDSPTRLMDSSVDIWDVADSYDDTTRTPTRSMDTSVNVWDVADKYDDTDNIPVPTGSHQPTLPGILNRQEQQIRHHQEREEQQHQHYRQSVCDSFTIDCGVPLLRHGSIYSNSMNYLDDKNFAVFSLNHQPSSWNEVFGQPFSESDYYPGSPKIIALFYHAFQQFYIVWNKPEYADGDTNGYDTHDISSLLGFLRFVSGCLSKCYQNEEDTAKHNATEMEQFIIGEMDIFILRVLSSVGWTDDTKMEWRGDNKTQYSSLPLLLVLFYSVEWSFQLGRLLSETSHWTMQITMQRLFWYLLSLGPTSALVTSTESYAFNVSNPFVVEAWILVLRLVKMEASDDTILWPCLQNFRHTIVTTDAFDNTGNIHTITALKKNEVIWHWILTILLLQQIQKNKDGIAVVNAHMNKDIDTQPYSLVQYLLTRIDYKNLCSEEPDNIITSITYAAGTRRSDHFYTMVGIRTTLCRYHLLMMRHRWNWDIKIMNIMLKWMENQAIQVLTGDPHRPMTPVLQEHLETQAKYFSPSILFYNGTFTDDVIDRLDTSGMVYLKVVSLGLRRIVQPILERNSDTHRKLLRHNLIRMIPDYLEVSGGTYSAIDNSKPTRLTPMALIYKYLHTPDPFIPLAYYYMTYIVILHATAPLGNENNPGLGVLKCNIVLQTNSDAVNAWAKDMSRLGHKIYGMVKKKWNLI